MSLIFMHIINEIQICAESFHSDMIFFQVTDIFTYNKGELIWFYTRNWKLFATIIHRDPHKASYCKVVTHLLLCSTV